jgi:hypothetical protein
MKGVIIKDLIINYSHVYKIFFGEAIPENRKRKKNSIVINRTSVNVRVTFFLRKLDYLPNFI